jgi:hypothetical protein
MIVTYVSHHTVPELAMNPAAEFRRHAKECLKTGKSSASREESISWKRMADRWLRCAEQAEKEDAAAQMMAAARAVRSRQSRVLGRSDKVAS